MSYTKEERAALRQYKKTVGKVKESVEKALLGIAGVSKVNWTKHSVYGDCTEYRVSFNKDAGYDDPAWNYVAQVHIEVECSGNAGWSRTITGKPVVTVRAGFPYGRGRITTRYPLRKDGTVATDKIIAKVDMVLREIRGKRKTARDEQRAKEDNEAERLKDLSGLIMPDWVSAQRHRESGRYTVTLTDVSPGQLQHLLKTGKVEGLPAKDLV